MPCSKNGEPKAPEATVVSPKDPEIQLEIIEETKSEGDFEEPKPKPKPDPMVVDINEDTTEESTDAQPAETADFTE